MSDCRFCSGKLIKPTGFGDGIKTVKTMLDGLLSSFQMSMEEDKETDHASGGIMLKDGSKLAFDNSSGEYAEMLIEIGYCPFCGRKLESRDN